MGVVETHGCQSHIDHLMGVVETHGCQSHIDNLKGVVETHGCQSHIDNLMGVVETHRKVFVQTMRIIQTVFWHNDIIYLFYFFIKLIKHFVATAHNYCISHSCTSLYTDK